MYFTLLGFSSSSCVFLYMFLFGFFLFIYPHVFSNAELDGVDKLAYRAEVTGGNCANLHFLEGEFQT